MHNTLNRRTGDELFSFRKGAPPYCCTERARARRQETSNRGDEPSVFYFGQKHQPKSVNFVNADFFISSVGCPFLLILLVFSIISGEESNKNTQPSLHAALIKPTARCDEHWAFRPPGLPDPLLLLHLWQHPRYNGRGFIRATRLQRSG